MVTSQVEASTIKAGTFFAENRFLVPDYQRKYSWQRDEQIADFWRDLHRALEEGDYFLGLVILADGDDLTEVVDGQQRLITLSLFANVLRLAAEKAGRQLVAESLRTDFLSSIDYQTEKQLPRLALTDAEDGHELAEVLALRNGSELTPRPESKIHQAHEALRDYVQKDLDASSNAALRVGQWTEFITKNLTFAVFTHPDRAAAFRVYEVVNTRGKDLTPAELIKSHVIGNSAQLDASSQARSAAHERWKNLEEQLDSVGALNQLTTFVRHVVTLTRGYVIPRNLYQEVTKYFAGSNGVEELLQKLEKFLPVYMQLVDPTVDIESSDVQARAFHCLDLVSAARFRPVILAASAQSDSDHRITQLANIIIPGIISGRFGSGNVEAQFARAARRAYQNEAWEEELGKLRSLLPERADLVARLKRPVNKQQALYLRSVYVREETLPELSGFVHQVRPKNAVGWEGFDNEEYREAGGLIGNWILTASERRPQGARTPNDVEEKLISETIDGEDVLNDLGQWTYEHVVQESERIAQQIESLWHVSG